MREQVDALKHLFIEAAEAAARPRPDAGLAARGCGARQKVSFDPRDGYPVMQAPPPPPPPLIERGVVGDFRAGPEDGEPHLLRFGLTTLYTASATPGAQAGVRARCWRAEPGARTRSRNGRRLTLMSDPKTPPRGRRGRDPPRWISRDMSYGDTSSRPGPGRSARSGRTTTRCAFIVQHR